MKNSIKVTNEIRRKVMKAAGTIYAKMERTAANWSKALKKAWAWARKTLLTVANQGVEVIAYDSYKETAKAICIDGIWFPKSQIIDVVLSEKTYFDYYKGEYKMFQGILVTNWIARKKGIAA